MMKGYIDDLDKVLDFIAHAYEFGFDQVVLRPIAMPNASKDAEAAEWTKPRMMDENELYRIATHFTSRATLIRELVHGGKVYSYKGQNVCLSNCLTMDAESKEEDRQIIWLPNQTLVTDWTYAAASRLL